METAKIPPPAQAVTLASRDEHVVDTALRSRVAPRSRGRWQMAAATAGAALLGIFSSACADSPEEGRQSREPAGQVTIANVPVDANIVAVQLLQPDCNPCDDFGDEPIVALANDAPLAAPLRARFENAQEETSAGACVVEPPLSAGDEPGALFPYNWLRPRIRFVPADGEDLWQLHFSAPRQRTPLVVYTDTPSWTMPREIWEGLGAHNRDTTVTLTIRGIRRDDPQRPPSLTRGSFGIAPVAAAGKLVYWATTSSEVTPTSSRLVGFSVGDERTAYALQVGDIGNRDIPPAGGRGLRSGSGVAEGHVQCIGCHVSTPDGTAVAFTDHWPWNNVLSLIIEGREGERPDYLTAGAERLLSQPWLGMQTMSSTRVFGSRGRYRVT